MNPDELLFIAVDPAGDSRAARLIAILEQELAEAESGYTDASQPLCASLAPRLYGVGGPEMEKIGLEQIRDQSGLKVWEQLPGGNGGNDRVFFEEVSQTALQRQPNAIICMGLSPVYRRLVVQIKSYAKRKHGPFFNWDPALIHIGERQNASSNSRKPAADSFDLDLTPNAMDENAFLKTASRAMADILKERKARLTLL